MKNTLELVLDNLYLLMTKNPDQETKIMFVVGMVEANLDRINKWRAEEYVQLDPDVWIGMLGELNMQGIGTPVNFPASICRREGGKYHVTKQLYTLTVGILDGTVGRECYAWYVDGVNDFCEGEYSAPE
jgi:hypothetical protein